MLALHVIFRVLRTEEITSPTLNLCCFLPLQTTLNSFNIPTALG